MVRYPLVVLLVLAGLTPCFGIPLPRLEPDPFFADAGKVEDPWPVDLMIESSLRASGVDEQNLDRYRDRILRLTESAGSALAGLSNDYDRAEALLAFLHDGVLVRYDFHQTRLDLLLDGGGFNCVSSGLLYIIIGRSLGLEVDPIYAVDHAFCFVRAGNTTWDVETTNPHGFDPGSKKEFTDSFTGKTGYTYVPPREYAKRMVISDREMVGFIFQNRIASLQRDNRHAETITLAVDRWAMTDSDMGRRDFLSTVRNTAAGYNNARSFEEGMILLLEVDRVHRVLEEPAVFEVFEALAHNGLAELLNRGDLSGAEAYYLRIRERGILSEEKLDGFHNLLERKKLDLLVKDGEWERITETVERGSREGWLEPDTRYRIYLFVYSREAERLARDAGYGEARRFLQKFPSDLAGKGEYLRLRETYRHNHSVSVHNTFARYYNAGEYDKARQLLEAAWKDLPGDERLLKDRELLEKKGMEF